MWCARAVVLVAGLGLAAGCGPSLGQVDGKLVWADGKPASELEGSEVVFEAATGGTSARGTVTKDGTFRLRSQGPDDGAPVGEYKVVVIEHRKLGPVEGTMLPEVLDLKFRDFKTSGLTASIKSGTNPLTLTVGKATASGKKG